MLTCEAGGLPRSVGSCPLPAEVHCSHDRHTKPPAQITASGSADGDSAGTTNDVESGRASDRRLKACQLRWHWTARPRGLSRFLR